MGDRNGSQQVFAVYINALKTNKPEKTNNT